MAESPIDRIDFPTRSAQRVFIRQAKEKLNTPWATLGKLCSVNSRTVRQWAAGTVRMPYAGARILAREAGLVLPTTARRLRWHDHLQRIAAQGGDALYRKYGRVGGDTQGRLTGWRKWWEEIGRHRSHPILYRRMPITRPGRSHEVAEFVGIMLGDGGMSAGQVTIAFHHADEQEYKRFVARMVQKIFGVNPRVYRDADSLADYLVVSRVALVDFCVKNLGLRTGSKVRSQVDMPDWVKRHSGYRVACTRGLIDTDGSVVKHRYRVAGIPYCYEKLVFTNHSFPLVTSVYQTLADLGLRPRLARGSEVRLDSRESMRQYFQRVGSHNPKHVRRYRG